MNIQSLSEKFPYIPKPVINKIWDNAYDLARISTNGRPDYASADKTILKSLELWIDHFEDDLLYDLTFTDNSKLKGQLGLFINFYLKNKTETQPYIYSSKVKGP